MSYDLTRRFGEQVKVDVLRDLEKSAGKGSVQSLRLGRASITSVFSNLRFEHVCEQRHQKDCQGIVQDDEEDEPNLVAASKEINECHADQDR